MIKALFKGKVQRKSQEKAKELHYLKNPLTILMISINKYFLIYQNVAMKKRFSLSNLLFSNIRKILLKLSKLIKSNDVLI
jgi:hypothetical protein